MLGIFHSLDDASLGHISTSRLISAALVACLFSIAAKGILRLWFHPLSKHPGPKLAALTIWWQCYYDVFYKGGGQFVARLEHLHKEYRSSVIRIGPNQLHFSEPRAYHDIYFPGTTFSKDGEFYRGFFIPEASSVISDRREAKRRRDILTPFFSRRALKTLEFAVQEKVDHLIDQLKTYKDEPVNMHMAYRSATLDIIMEYLFARCYDAISARHFRNITIVSLQEGVKGYAVFRHFTFLYTIFQLFPDWLLIKLNPSARGFIEVVNTCRKHAEEVVSNPEEKLHNASHEIVYHHLVTPDPAKRHEMPSIARLSDEAIALLNAGSDTVGGTSTIGTFHILYNKEILRKLRTELDEARKEREMGPEENMGFEVLEKLPYLTAVIKESLRLSYGVVRPLPRVVGPEDAVIGGYTVPKGTVVSIGTTFIHNNPEIFPDPFKFDPERWLKGPESKRLGKWLVSFSAGPSQCLGMNLAWTELYLIFGNVFSKLDMEIYNMTLDDITTFVDCFVPVYPGNKLHCYVKARWS